MFGSVPQEIGKVFDPCIVLSIEVVEEKEVDVVKTLAFGAQVLHAEALIFRIQ